MTKSGKIVFKETFSNGLPLIFLHAFPLNSQMWEPQIEYCRSKKINYIALDFPGFGGISEDSKINSMKGYSAFVRDTLGELEVPGGILVGSSMGGYVGLQFLHDYPDYIYGFILANSRTTADSSQIRENRMNMISELSSNRNLQAVIDSLLAKFLTSDSLAARPDLVRTVVEMMQSASIEGVISAQKAMSEREDYTRLLKSLKQPVHIIASDNDNLVPLSESQELVNQLQNARLTIIHQASHISNLERPEEFNAAIWDFLSEFKQPVPE